MAEPFDFANAVADASKDPSPPAVAAKPPLQGGAVGTDVGANEPAGSASGPNPPVVPQPPKSEPLTPVAPPEAKPIKGADMPKPPDIHGYDTSYHFDQKAPEPPKEANFLDQMARGVGQLGAGLLGGGINMADTAKAAIEAPGRMMTPGQQAPYQSWQQDYERGQAPGTVESFPYKAGEFIGQGVTYGAGAAGVGMAAAAAGAPAALAGTAALAAGALEGAAVGGASSAQSQLRLTGKISKKQMAADTAIGGAFGLGMGALGNAVRNIIGNALKNRKAITTATAEKDAMKIWQQEIQKVQQAVNKHEADALTAFNEHFGTPEPPQNGLQKLQQEALAVAETKGKFRLRKSGIGFELFDTAIPLDDLAKDLPAPVFNQLRTAAYAVALAKVTKAHFENEVAATAKNALSLAKTAAQKAVIKLSESTRLHSAQQVKVDALRAQLELKQNQEQKAAIQKKIESLTAKMAGSLPKMRASLQKEIQDYSKALEELTHPKEFYDIRTDKHLKSMIDRSEIEHEGRPLASTYDLARQQFYEAMADLNAANKQYTALKDSVKDQFMSAEKAYQDIIGEPTARLWVKLQRANKLGGGKVGTVAIGTQFNGHLRNLNRTYQAELKAYQDSLMAEEENVVREITYQVADPAERLKLAHQTGEEAKQRLADLKVLHPIAERLALSAAFGLVALDTPAEAADGKTRKQERHLMGNLGMALAASIIAAKYGPVVASKIMRSPSYYFLRCYANTRDLCKFADSALGISPAIHAGASLGHNLQELGGKVVEAVTMCPDDTEYLMQCLRKQIEPDLLSEPGKAYMAQIQDLAKSMKSFLPEYRRTWSEHYSGLAESDKDYLKPVNEAVHFVANQFGQARYGDMTDSIFAKLMTNSTRAIFTLRPKTFLSQIADIAISGPLQVGPAATARAYKEYTSNPLLRDLVSSRVKTGSAISQGLKEVNAKAQPLLAEKIQSRVGLLASLFHYHGTHPRAMGAIGIKSEADFAMKALAGELPDDIKADVFIQAHADLADMIGADPLMLNYDWIGRSPAGFFLRWASQPMRYARLLAKNTFPDIAEPGMQPVTSMPQLAKMMTVQVAKGNLPWLAASLGVLWQYAGSAAVPKSWQLAGWHYAPTQTAQLIAFLNMTSTGQHVLGNMSSSVDYDPFFAPFMGTFGPGFENAQNIANDASGVSDQMADVLGAMKNPSILMASKANEHAEKAQHALRALLDDISLAIPQISVIPTQALSAFIYHLPEAIHGNLAVTVPRPVLGGGGTNPLEGKKVKRFKAKPGESQQGADFRARLAGVGKMLRMGDSLEETNYKTARTGVHYEGLKNPALNELQNNSL